jgi:CubicO group peptidase (beta-lactamase class C family)
MRRAPMLAVAVLLIAPLACAQDIAAKADEYMQAHVRVNRFMGSVLVARDGKVLFERGYGMANLEHGIPNTPQTKFRLGSITKQFTSMAVLMLEERGKLKVDDPICKYLDPCPAAWSTVTIHHLLTHTSGIPSYTGLPDYREKMTIPAAGEKMVARFRDLPLEFSPGEKFAYDNSGYFLLGLIVEKVGGKSYEDFLKTNIFEPLGMRDMGYDHFETVIPRRASGYALRGGEMVHASYLDMSQPYAAGSLYSTVEDLLLWDQALYTEKLVKKAALDRIFTPFKNNYAYGWGVTRRLNRRVIAHGGGINGFVTSIARYPEDRTLVVVLCNRNGIQPARAGEDLAAIAFGEKYEIPK